MNKWSHNARLVGQGHHCVWTVRTLLRRTAHPLPWEARRGAARPTRVGGRTWGLLSPPRFLPLLWSRVSWSGLGTFLPLCGSHRKELSLAPCVWGTLARTMLPHSSPTLQGSACLSLPSSKEGAWGAGPWVPMRPSSPCCFLRGTADPASVSSLPFPAAAGCREARAESES